MFIKIYKQYFEQAFPLRRRKINPNKERQKPWITKGIITSRQRLKNINILILSGNEQILDKKYKSYIENY